MLLNKEQLEVVNFCEGQCVVAACPGSGKTHTITERVARLIEQGIPSSNILCLTFTNKAAKEMKKRILNRLDEKELDSYIGTFHAFCLKLLRQYGHLIGYTPSLSVYDDGDRKTLYYDIMRQMGINPKDKTVNIYNLSYHLDRSRELLETDHELMDRYKNVDEYKVAVKYLESLKEYNAIDFSGLLYDVVRLLEDNTEILEYLQDIFRFIQVDEMQDTNYVQFRLVNLLSEKHKNVVIVGDISQSIFSFRGARYQNIINFMDMHLDCKQVSLHKNYRSTPQIIHVADKLITINSTHVGKKAKTDNQNGSFPLCKSFPTSRDEATGIAQKIKYFVEEEGWDYGDISIFYRLNRLSLEIQTALSKLFIPFTVIGGPSFFNRLEIKDSIAMLKWLSNPKDKVAFQRVISLFSGIGQVTYDKLVKLANDNAISLMEACLDIDKLTNTKAIKKAAKKIHDVFSFDFSKMHAGKALSLLVSKIKYEDYLKTKSKGSKDYDDRLGNVNELIVHATQFGQMNSDIDAYLQNIALISSVDKQSGEKVSLMTLHASKGLEFPIVFIVGVEESILPHVLALKDAKTDDEKLEALEEERRICYVGITRAEKHLYLSFCKKRLERSWSGMRFVDKEPSRFLKEAGLLI